MKKLSIILFLFVYSLTTLSQSLNNLDSASYFDFWVGDWTASWDEGNGMEQLGTNTITKSLDEKVIVENFRIIKGQSEGFKGMSMSVFQPRFNRWKQAWTDNQGGYFDFTGEFDGDKRIFKTLVTERASKQILQRMVFYDIQNDAMTWDWESSQDGGETWSLQWRIFYKKSN
ncbi:MAG: hypothetical protein ACJA08_000895 [Cyclobacteriaceae bacterium]|jgi:hypothetical protein